MSENNKQEPSMLGGHAQYAKGYVEETVGSVTGSEEWTASGKSDTQAGVEQMKAASAHKTNEPAPSSLGGRVEELAGKAAGCEGMENEGAERRAKADS